MPDGTHPQCPKGRTPSPLTLSRSLRAALLVTLVCVGAESRAEASDWPEWRGARRDGVSTETALLRQWPRPGPRLLWSAAGAGAGYSSPAIAGGRIYVTGLSGSQEKLSVFDLNGRLVWERIFGRAWTKSFPESRSTPTVRDGAVYVTSGMGEVVCLAASDGRVRWSVDAATQFGARPGPWGTAESPLIVGDKVIYTPGGSKTTVVALDRQSGKTVWTSPSLDDQGGYVSPIVIDVAGRQQIVAMTGNYVLGVDPREGRIEWRVRFGDIAVTEDGGDITTNTPLHWNGRIFVTSGYNHAGVMVQLAPDGRRAEVAWVAPALDNHHGHVVRVGDHLYGSNWLNNHQGHWVCLDWQSGRTAYETEWATKGSIIAADGMLYAYDERNGHLALVKATPQGFQPVSTFRVTQGDGPHWAHPAISDGRLYVRHGDALLAYDIKATAAAAR